MNRKVYVACNVDCLIETQKLLKVTNIHVRCESGNVLETVQDRYLVTTDHEHEVTYSLPNSGNSDELERSSESFTYCKSFQTGFFVQACSSWQYFN